MQDVWQKSVTKVTKVTKSRVLNEASLEPKKFHAVKCPRINLNYNSSNISGKLMEFSNQIRSDFKLSFRNLWNILRNINGLLNSFKHLLSRKWSVTATEFNCILFCR